MRRGVLFLLWIMVCVPLGAQTTHRDSVLSTIGYCYEQMKDYDHALEWYEKYLKEARPGTPSYDFVVKSIDYIKSERFMTSGD